MNSDTIYYRYFITRSFFFSTFFLACKVSATANVLLIYSLYAQTCESYNIPLVYVYIIHFVEQHLWSRHKIMYFRTQIILCQNMTNLMSFHIFFCLFSIITHIAIPLQCMHLVQSRFYFIFLKFNFTSYSSASPIR